MLSRDILNDERGSFNHANNHASFHPSLMTNITKIYRAKILKKITVIVTDVDDGLTNFQIFKLIS